VSPFEVNTRILRIGNVVQSSPYASFAPAFHAIPQYNHNSLQPQFTYSNLSPTPTASYPQSAFPNAGVAFPVDKSSYSYSYFNTPYPTKPSSSNSNNFYPTTLPQLPSAYIPQSSSSPHIQSASTPYHNPITSFFKFRGSSPYAYERFNAASAPNAFTNEKYPFQQLNAGETIPQTYVNFNNYGNDDYFRQTRYVGSSLRNTTSTSYVQQH
jgi:hypothetical protein